MANDNRLSSVTCYNVTMTKQDCYNEFFELAQQKINFSFFELSLPDDDPVYTLKKEGLVTLEVLYIDGTKIEANANRYTFIWRGTINYHLAGLLDTIDALDVYKRQVPFCSHSIPYFLATSAKTSFS